MSSSCTGETGEGRRSTALPVLPNTEKNAAKIPHSRISRWRAGALILLTALMVAHFIQWQISGSTVSPIEPSEAMQTLSRGAINAGFIFFALAILSTLVLGRWICGWACHVVALQDLAAWMLKKVGIKPRPFRSRLLIWVPLLAALYMFGLPVLKRVLAPPPGEGVIPQFTNHIVTQDFWSTFPTLAVAIPFLFICGFVTVYFLGSKGFCTYACPYGGFFAVADKVAVGRIRVTDACDQCGFCTATCTSNVIVHAEVREHGMVVDPGCMKCMDCVSVCPTNALYYGFGKPSLGTANKVKKTFSLTWPEEIGAAVFFLLSLYAVWDTYQLIPMLLALALAGITTFLAWRTYRLFVSKDLSLYQFNLKNGGKVTRAGSIFLVLSLVWLGLTAHSGWIRYHEWQGANAFEAIHLPDEVALAQANPAQWLSPADKQNIAAGRTHFSTARNNGLFTNVQALSKLAWLEYLGGDAGKATDTLADASAHEHGAAKALADYYRGAILNRTGKHAEAITSLDAALKERPDLTLALEQKGEALWSLRRQKDAFDAWSQAVRENPNLPLATSFLAGAAKAAGDDTLAANFQARADQLTPNDPLFHFMLGMRLKAAGMDDLADQHFARAIEMNPRFKAAKRS